MSVSDVSNTISTKDLLANSSKKTSSTADGIASATNSSTGGQALGKDAFLQLLVTQLKNQNPLDPQDNSAFVAQLAQFSSLEGITTLNSTVSGLAGNYNSSQALQASSLVGRNVIVQTNTAQLDDPTKGLTGSVTVPSSIAGGTVTITDKDGKTVRTIDLGSRAAAPPASLGMAKTLPAPSCLLAHTPSRPTHRSTAPRRTWRLTCQPPSTASRSARPAAS